MCLLPTWRVHASPVLDSLRCRLTGGATPMQLALAWLLHRARNILLIPGTSSIGQLLENLAAAELTLTDKTLAELGAIDAQQAPWTPGTRSD
jgi:aryl-alcohol dehydrogenase-like predicted oxidoreductase